MSTPLTTSIKTPESLCDILGKYAPIKSSIPIVKVISGHRTTCYQLDISQLTEQQLRGLANYILLSPCEIKERGFFLPALKNSTVFGVPD